MRRGCGADVSRAEFTVGFPVSSNVAGKWTIDISEFPTKTSIHIIHRGFSIAMFDYQRVVAEFKTHPSSLWNQLDAPYIGRLGKSDMQAYFYFPIMLEIYGPSD